MTARDRYTAVRTNQRLVHRGRAREGETMSMFAQPSAPTGSGIIIREHLGSLLLIEPTSFESQIVTENGPTDAVRANVTVIEGNGAGDTFESSLIFGRVLVSQLRNSIGQKVLGRIAQGEKKAGKNAPWLLNEATAADIAKAEAWVARNTRSGITSAEPPF